MKKLVLVLAATMVSSSAMAQVVHPINYDCRGKNVELNISLSSETPFFNYMMIENGEKTTISQHGEHVDQTHMVLGTLYSMMGPITIMDGPTFHVSVVIPDINNVTEAEFKTMAVETVYGNTIGGPGFVRGVIQRSKYIPVTCKAEAFLP
jgi:hypothetical protein